MAVDDRGERNRPIFAGTGASADAEDLTGLGQLITDVGTRRVGTTSDRRALDPGYMFHGMLFYETDTRITWRVNATGDWVIQSYVSGLIALPGLSGNFKASDGAGYRIDGTRREIEGQLTKSINGNALPLASGDRLWTFEEADRPKYNRFFNGVGSAGATMRLRVDATTGLVSVDSEPTSSTGYVRLEGIFWRVDN